MEVIYKKWFRVNEEAQTLAAAGQTQQAEQLRANFAKEATAAIAKVQKIRANMKRAGLRIGSLPFRIAAADPQLEDPALDAMDFISTPVGYTYQTYMYGYFRDMVAHELGHNLGLRHNFKGNLGNNESGEIGSPSRSVMEYLSRRDRHLDRVSAYDVMAIAFGYKGQEPEHRNWFCTDEDEVDSENYLHSAECSSSDATSDPFTELLTRLAKAKSFLFLPGSEQGPVWTVEILTGQLSDLFLSFANYYVSSLNTAGDWTNFINPTRQPSVAEIPDFILNTIKGQICDPHLEEIIATKTPDGQVKARENLVALRHLFKEVTSSYQKPVSAFTVENFPCLQGL